MYTHPTTSYQLAQTKIADLHRQAAHDRLARAARQARRGPAHRTRDSVPGFLAAITRRALAGPDARTT
jgi:hypothetical protein